MEVLVTNLESTVCDGREFENGVKGAPQVRQLVCGQNHARHYSGHAHMWPRVRGGCPRTCGFVQEVGEQAAHHSLVADDQHVFLPLQLHDHWLQTMDQVLIRLDRGQKVIQERQPPKVTVALAFP